MPTLPQISAVARDRDSRGNRNGRKPCPCHESSLPKVPPYSRASEVRLRQTRSGGRNPTRSHQGYRKPHAISSYPKRPLTSNDFAEANGGANGGRQQSPQVLELTPTIDTRPAMRANSLAPSALPAVRGRLPSTTSAQPEVVIGCSLSSVSSLEYCLLFPFVASRLGATRDHHLVADQDPAKGQETRGLDDGHKSSNVGRSEKCSPC